MKSFLAKKGEVDRKWWLVDAEGQILGRLASQVASLLRGKTKPEFTENVDTGDFVIVVNAEKVKLSGKKELQKVYYNHSRKSGGLTARTVQQLRAKNPREIILKAVRGMLPKRTLGEKQLTKLKVYSGSTHPHQVQKPQELKVVKGKGKQ